MVRKVMVSANVWDSDVKRNVKKEMGEAVFHQFGVDYEEFSEGPGMFSAAIIEWPGGQVEIVRADHIRFLDKPEQIVRLQQC